MLNLWIQACCTRDSGLHPYTDNAATASVVISLLRAFAAFLESAVSIAVAVAEVAFRLMQRGTFDSKRLLHPELVRIVSGY